MPPPEYSYVDAYLAIQTVARLAEDGVRMILSFSPREGHFQIHAYGRQLIGQGKAEAALAIFEKNAERFPDGWPVHVGLARGHSALGHYEKALEHAKMALGQAPSDASRGNVEGLIKTLEEGKDIN